MDARQSSVVVLIRASGYGGESGAGGAESIESPPIRRRHKEIRGVSRHKERRAER